MSNKIKFKINSDKFADLISKLEDLTKIENNIKLKIDNDDILIYSIMGDKIMLAFKSYLVKTRDYLDYKDDIDFTLDVIITNAKKFVKNLNFLSSSDNITLDISYKESQDDDFIMVGRSLQISGGRLKVNWALGEHYELRDINKTVLSSKLNIKDRKWSFNINNSDFADIKKLSNINGERIINIGVDGGVVKISERSSWEIEIDQIESRNSDLILNKKFLNSIDDKVDNIEFSIFDTFMLITNDDSNLLLSFEQDFEDDES